MLLQTTIYWFELRSRPVDVETEDWLATAHVWLPGQEPGVVIVVTVLTLVEGAGR
jgi:hypothetical protein